MPMKELVYKGYIIESSPMKLKEPPDTFSPHGFIQFDTDDNIAFIKLKLDEIPDDKWVCSSEDEAHERFIESAKKFIDRE